MSAFTAAVVALKVCSPSEPQDLCPLVTRIYPGEPAGWANLGLTHLRGHHPDLARPPLDRALQLAPSYGQSIHTYDPSSPGALCYLDIAREIAERGAGGTSPPGQPLWGQAHETAPPHQTAPGEQL